MELKQRVIRDVTVAFLEAGKGRPLVYLHGGFGLTGHEAFIGHLAERFRVIAPDLPGFGATELPRSWNVVDDLAFFGLDLLAEFGLDDALLAGSCLGGWVAAEMAVRSTGRLRGLVLIDATGLKFGDHLTREITDIHAMGEAEQAETLYADPSRARRDTTAMSDQELAVLAQNRESFALFGWKPYMHNPVLRRWVHRIDVPALVVWGDRDRMVTPDYGRNWAAALPDATFELVGDAGHYPAVEQPGASADTIISWSEETVP